MIIKDDIYQEFEITSPVVLDLINTAAFQRLKKISQFGIPDEYYHIRGFSRYEHSLGVYELLRRLGASHEEQIAGLLHDVSHAAFSHLIDWVVGDSEKEDYQDKRHLSVILRRDISEVLERHGYSPREVADYHGLGLLEREAPDLCADRIDYLLREVGTETAEVCLPQLCVSDGEIVFTEQSGALLFASKFLDCQVEHWAGYEAVTRYVIFSGLLKRAIGEGIVSLGDLLHQTDDYVIGKLAESGDMRIVKVFELLRNRELGFLPKSEMRLKKKFRHVNPKVLRNGVVVRLSDIDKEFGERLERERELNKGGCLVGRFEIWQKWI